MLNFSVKVFINMNGGKSHLIRDTFRKQHKVEGVHVETYKCWSVRLFSFEMFND